MAASGCVNGPGRLLRKTEMKVKFLRRAKTKDIVGKERRFDEQANAQMD